MTKLLIVDDNEQNLYMLQVLLTGHGYGVVSAGDGAEALEKARRDPPDVIIADILMPVMDGFTLCREWKKDSQLQGIPFVFYTATYTDPKDEEFALSLGAERFIVKPVKPDVFVEMLQEVIEEHEAGRLVAPRQPVAEEAVYFKEYNETLIRKLEDKMLQLEEANRALERDIGERKRAEEALRESEETLKAILAAPPVGVGLVRDRVLDWANQTMYSILGYEKGALLGKSAEVLYPDAEEYERAGRELYYGVERGGIGQVETQWVTKDGKVIDCDLRASPLNPSDPSKGIIVTMHDITERKRAEEQLRQQEQLAAVGQLAGGIAHDFNNLLTTIMLYAQMGMGRPDLPPDVARAFETILDESRKAAELVQQILDFSRHAMIKVRPLDLESFTGEVLAILRRAIPENIRLTLAMGTEEYVVNADPTRIQQVLMNLATNARDAMPEGGELRFELSRVDAIPAAVGTPPRAGGAGGGWICLAVSDTGTGMTEEVRSHLFEPFFTTKEPGKGTGLGLAQVYGIVRQHEGYIGVETEVGKGTTFRIYLPASGPEGVVGEEEVVALPQGQGETILLVEDNEGVREAAQEILEPLGYRVLTAENGREALEVYWVAQSGDRPQQGVDLVITDVVMPEMGGKMLIRKLREANPGLKGLAITGYIVEEDVQRLRKAGFLDVVRKPFDVDALARTVRRALDVE